jgi:hypothetical protein
MDNLRIVAGDPVIHEPVAPYSVEDQDEGDDDGHGAEHHGDGKRGEFEDDNRERADAERGSHVREEGAFIRKVGSVASKLFLDHTQIVRLFM